MIKTFKDPEAQKIFQQQFSTKLPQSIQKIALRKLMMLHAAEQLGDLASPPGNRLEVLHGDRQGQFSIRINQQFRICFVWKHPDAYNVEIVDYH